MNLPKMIDLENEIADEAAYGLLHPMRMSDAAYLDVLGFSWSPTFKRMPDLAYLDVIDQVASALHPRLAQTPCGRRSLMDGMSWREVG